MGNPHRGEASIELGGRRYILRLTLQALAEIETAFAVDGLEALGARFGSGKLGTRDMLSILGALVRGGGERIADSDLASTIEAQDLPAIISAISAVFAASFAGSGATTAGPR
ncbi:MAG: hypothetical protein FD175_2537 [Beijerinckiaceae bacterium]|nr:MAG: hypothetical protein FD175_2537 [Beijerinckiaceae bacterium]